MTGAYGDHKDYAQNDSRQSGREIVDQRVEADLACSCRIQRSQAGSAMSEHSLQERTTDYT